MLPTGDWQFWAATGVVLVVIATPIFHRLRKRRGKRVTLTIDGRNSR
jgi:hypothetical protein